MADVISREVGFVAPAAADFTLMEAAMPLSIALGTFGVAASLLGNWQAKVGPSYSMKCAAVVYSSSLFIGALGVHLHSLPVSAVNYHHTYVPKSITIFSFYTVVMDSLVV